MEAVLLAVFLILFCGRTMVRFGLQQLNIRHLKTHAKTLPAALAGAVDEVTLARMADYTSDQSSLESKENLAGDVVELLLLFGLVPVLAAWLTGIDIHVVLQALIFFTILSAISGIAGLPFDLYHTFVVEKKYGFSTMTWSLWLGDLIKSALIAAVLLAIIVSALIALITYLPQSWWFWGWLFFVAFQILLLWLYPVVIAPLFNTFEPIRDEVLALKIEKLLELCGLQARGIYQVDAGKRSRHTNAYFTGFGKSKRIVLYDTLIASHTHEEMLSVLAHEIGHWKKKHLLKQLGVMVMASGVVLYIIYQVLGWPVLYSAFRLEPTAIWAGLFLVSLYLGAAGFLLTPLWSAASRRFEREADKMAFDLTGTTRPMISALGRLAKDNLSNLHPHPWYVRFHYSHPPLVERIKYLEAMDDRKTARQELI